MEPIEKPGKWGTFKAWLSRKWEGLTKGSWNGLTWFGATCKAEAPLLALLYLAAAPLGFGIAGKTDAMWISIITGFLLLVFANLSASLVSSVQKAMKEARDNPAILN